MPRGGVRPGQGRPRKADELKIVNQAVNAITETYGSLEEGFKALLKTGEPSLIKWVFEHAAGKPQDKVDVTTNGKDVGGHTVTFRDFSKDGK